MDKPEALAKLRHLSTLLEKALNDPQLESNTTFLKSLVQQNAIDLYQAASSLDAPASTPKNPEIKIIRQEEVLPKKPAAPPAPVPVAEPEQIPVAVTVPEPVEIKKPAEPEPKPAETPKPPKPVVKMEEPVSEEKDAELTLNDRLAKNKKPVQNIADKSVEKPISDLVKHISIVKKFEFINGLFDGNADAYKTALSNVESSGSYEAATQYLGTTIVDPYDWQSNEELAAEFFALVKRRYL